MRIRIAQKPFQILEMLLQEPGNVVSRQTLREQLWPDTHVGYEHSLNTAINTLRELLGDSAQSPRYIETMPRVGYRFVASVQRPGPGCGKHTLVVLPFANLTGQPAEDFFADGLHEEITTQIGLLDPSRLAVIARTTAVVYKEAPRPIAEIAAELRADYVLEGSIRASGQAMRITTQLIHGVDQSHEWSASFDSATGDALAIQCDIAAQVAAGVSAKLIGAPPRA